MSNDYLIPLLNKILNETQNLMHYRYLLIDALASVSELSSISLPALRNKFPNDAIFMVKRPDMSHDVKHCPYVVCLAAPGEYVEPHYIYRSAKESLSEYELPRRYISGWLISDRSPQEVAEIIEQVGLEIGRQESGGFIPFYEPFRLSLLNRDDQLSRYWLTNRLGGILHFYYVDEECCLADVIVDKSYIDNELIYLPKSLLFYQREAKSLFYLYDSYKMIVRDNNQDLTEKALASLCLYYQQAINLGINHLADRYIFAFYAMRYSDFINDVRVMDAVNQAIQDPGMLRYYFIKIDNDSWLENL